MVTNYVFISGMFLSLFIANYLRYRCFLTDVFSPSTVNFLFLALCFFVAPFYYTSVYDTHLNLRLQLALLTGLAGYAFGIFIIKTVPYKGYKISHEPREYVFYFIPIITVTFLYLILKTANVTLGFAIQNASVIRHVLSNGGLSPLYFVIGSFTTFINIYLAYNLILRKNYSKLKLLIGYSCTALICLLLGSQGLILQMLSTPVLFYNIYKKKIRLYQIFLLVLITIYLLIIYSNFRAGEGIALVGGSALLLIFQKIISRYDAFMNANKLYENLDLQFHTFRFISDFFQFYSLRSLNPDKPYFFQVDMSRDVFFPSEKIQDLVVTFDFTGLAEIDYSFGLLGVMLLGILSGSFQSKLVSIYHQPNRFQNIVIFYIFYSALPRTLLTDKVTADIYLIPIVFVYYLFCFKMLFRRTNDH